MGFYFLFLLQFLFQVRAAVPAPWSINSFSPKPITKQWAPGALNVHFVPHTHDDVGWLKTVDQYYVGQNTTIQHAGVQYILDSVVDELLANPARRFIYVEQAFFQRWWRQQDNTTKDNVRQLVSQGRLEFVNGGWCMHDEAATHYVAMVDQTTVGHRYIYNQFGAVPRVGWQIDPFGHSSTHAALLSKKVGFEALFIGRIDYQDRQIRINESRMEFIWQASPSYGASSSIFTGAFWDGNYQPPAGFCFDDVQCTDQFIQDNPNLEDYNVQDRVNQFVEECYQLAETTLGNDIMLKFGSDFNYENAHSYFKNLDKLIQYVNQDGRLNAFYSTPSVYADAKIKSNITWTYKYDDFFPYSDCQHCMWTGYFTSRAALKKNVRVQSNLLNLCRQLETFNRGDGSATRQYEEEVAVAQHHDGVSGTSKQHVAYDYAKRMSNGSIPAIAMATTVLANIIKGSARGAPPVTICPALNETSCALTQGNAAFAIYVYNPQAHARQELIRIPLNVSSVKLFDAQGNSVPFQVFPVISTPVPNVSPAPYSLNFISNTPALGYTTYFVQPASTDDMLVKEKEIPTGKDGSGDTVTLENAAVSISFDTISGKMTNIIDKQSGLKATLQQDWLYYLSYFKENDQNSGAYIFRPNGTTAYPACGGNPTIKLTPGTNVQEVRQTFCDWITQTVRLVGDSPAVEIEYNIGSIPIDDEQGREVVTRFTTDLKSNLTCYTDSNGREILTRIYNYRPTWDLVVYEPVAGNYYPINSVAYIKDTSDNRQLTILNDRAQGGGSLNNGQLEMMPHRRTLHDDSRGVGEPLNETQSITREPTDFRLGPGLGITGKFQLLFGPAASSASLYRPLASRVFAEPLIGFTPMASTSSAVSDWIKTYVTASSFSASPLPANIELMTLMPWDNNSVLLRLSHQFAINEDIALSLPVTLDLSTLFKSFTITSVTEVSLTANQQVGNTILSAPFWVTLNPMDIKTYRITVS